MFRTEDPHRNSLWLLSVSIRFTESVTITVAIVKEETPFVIARDHTYPDHTITMVDNGARVFVLAEKILLERHQACSDCSINGRKKSNLAAKY